MIALVSSRMVRKVHFCAPSDSLAQAAQIMWEKDIGWLPVLSSQGNLVGVITDRDICMAAYTRGIRLDEGDVAGVMSRKVVYAQEDDAILDIEHVMKISQLRRFPVVDHSGFPVGVITLSDLARAELDAGGRSEAAAAGVALTLAVVAGPRHPTPLAAE